VVFAEFVVAGETRGGLVLAGLVVVAVAARVTEVVAFGVVRWAMA
jgi:hypothetical protein